MSCLCCTVGRRIGCGLIVRLEAFCCPSTRSWKKVQDAGHKFRRPEHSVNYSAGKNEASKQISDVDHLVPASAVGMCCLLVCLHSTYIGTSVKRNPALFLESFFMPYFTG